MAQHLTEEDYEVIKKLRAEGMSVANIAKRFSKSDSTISNIINGKCQPKGRSSLTDTEIDGIKYLKSKGLMQKDIAKKIGRSNSVVCMAFKQLAESEGLQPRYKEPDPVKTIDLSKLPDTVLFKHTREFCF